MPSPTKSKNGVYYYIVRVPRDLVSAVGKDRISESLRTKDPQIAKQLFTERYRHSLKDWETLRSPVHSLSQKEAVALAGTAYRDTLNAFQDNPGPPEGTEAWRNLTQRLEASPRRLEEWYRPTMDELLLKVGLRVDEESKSRLLRQLHVADNEAISQLHRNASGDYAPDPKADRFPAWTPAKAPSEVAGVTLSALFSYWERSHVMRNGPNKTISDFKQKIGSLSKFLEHDDAQRIQHPQLVAWCDYLQYEEGKTARLQTH